LNRSYFLKALGLLGLTSCIEEEIMNKKQLYDWWAGGSSAPSTEELGEQFNQSSFPNTTGYTAVGASISSVSDKLRITNGTPGYSRYVYLNDFITALQKQTQTFRFIAVDQSGTSYGACFGWRSINTFAAQMRGLRCQFVQSTGASLGKLVLCEDVGTAADGILATSGSALTFAAGDQIELILTFNGSSFSALARNLTSPTSDLTVSVTLSVNAYELKNTCRPTIWCIGGTQDLTLWNISSTQRKGGVLIIGDSVAWCSSAGTFAQGYSQLLNDTYGDVTLWGGPGDGSAAGVAGIAEIKSLVPRKAVIALGANDIGYSVPSGTWQANLATINSELVAIGVPVYHLLYASNTTPSLAALTTWVNSTYSASRIMEPGFITLLDNVHPTTTGHAQLQSFIEGTGKLA